MEAVLINQQLILWKIKTPSKPPLGEQYWVLTPPKSGVTIRLLGFAHCSAEKAQALRGCRQTPPDRCGKGDGVIEGLDYRLKALLREAEKAKELLRRGEELVGAARVEEAVEDLREALKLDSNNQLIRTALFDALTQLFRDIVGTDQDRAELALDEAARLGIDSDRVESLRPLLADHREEAFVNNCARRTYHPQADRKLVCRPT